MKNTLLTNWKLFKKWMTKDEIKQSIEDKWKEVFMNVDCDFNGYLAIQRAKNKELTEAGVH